MTFTRLLSTAGVAVFLCLAGLGESQASDLKVTEMAVTTKIVKGSPIDSVRSISSSSVKALYCFTRFQAPQGTDTTIKHIWYRDDAVMHGDEMPVKGSRWRTYSQISVQKGHTGEWRCDVVDSEGTLLKSVSFRMN